jgi:hypothetical protein
MDIETSRKAIPKGMRKMEHNLNTNRSRESKSKYNRNKILGNNRKNLIRSVDSLSVCPITISSPESSEYYEKIWDRRYNDTQYHRFECVIL